MDKERGKRPDQFTLEDATRLARETALEFSGHKPTIMAEGSKRLVTAELANLPDTFEDKVDLMLSAGVAFGQSGEVGELKQVFFISEAWVSIGDKGKTSTMKPSRDPNRKEVIVITNLAIKEQQAGLILLEMIRDTKGQLTGLTEIVTSEEDVKVKNVRSPLLDAFVEGFSLGKTRLN